ncbi:MAG: peptide chain release factor 1, partial [Cytophagales bacterium]
YKKLNKEYKNLGKIVSQIDLYEKHQRNLEANKSFLKAEQDPSLLALAREEQTELLASGEVILQALKTLLIPQNPNDAKNIIMEFRAGTGGDEASIWAGDLFRMYQRFAESQKWRFEVLAAVEGSSGGYKEIICKISGEAVYGMMKYEAGVHRVQRVPATESKGRIHTSAAIVCVLLEADEIDIKIDPKEIKKETFCSSGPGGQSVNTTYSAVRLTHLPTGTVVSCQDGKSQTKNLASAYTVLRARLYEFAMKAQQADRSEKRRTMTGSGDRSAKIRTYNYPHAWVNDHRINYTDHNLMDVLDGNLGNLVEALRLADQADKLAQFDGEAIK